MKLLKRMKGKISEVEINNLHINFSLIILQIIAIILLFMYSYNKYIVEVPFFSKYPPLKKVCYLGIHSIIRKKVTPFIFKENIVDSLQESEYKNFGLVGGEKIEEVFSDPANNICTIIISDIKGIRAFKFELTQSTQSRHVFNMVVKTIKEIEENEIFK